MTEPSDTVDEANLPAIIPPGRSGALTPLPDGNLIPALIADAGDQAAWRYIDYFTSNSRVPSSRLHSGGP